MASSSAVHQPQNDDLIRFANRRFSQFSYQNNVYCVPVDQSEYQRLEDLDGILRELFSGRTVFPTLTPPEGRGGSSSNNSFPTVLDCGCGKGAWIEHFMDEFGGDSDVTGVDIFFGQSTDDDDEDEDDEDDDETQEVQEFVKKRWNLNARFREDRSEDRLRPETFDLINSALLAEGIDTDRWPSYIRELKQMLKPGGWLQMVEVQLHFQSSTGLLRDDSNLTRWWEYYAYGLQQMGKNVRIGRDLPRLLAAEGFEHVRHLSLDAPIGDWSSEQASLGRDNLDNVDQLLTSLSLWPFLRICRMDENTYRNLVNGARTELREARYRLYYKVHVAYGQRPRARRR